MMEATDEDISKLKQTQSAEAKAKETIQDISEEDHDDENMS